MADGLPPRFTIQKISNHGASNPIVARIAMQTHELLQGTTLSEDKRGDTMQLYAMDILRRMLKFNDAHLRLKKARMDTLMETQRIEDQGSRTVPYVIGLADEVETMLVEAKSIIRDTLGLFEIFFAKTFSKKETSRLLPKNAGDAGEVLVWAKERFGPDSKVYGALIWYQPLFRDVVNLRNAAEHPGDKAGTLVIENFRREAEGGLVPPSWRIDGGGDPMAELPLYRSLAKLEDGLLTYCEDILAACCLTACPSAMVTLAEIPEAERKPEAPVRLKWWFTPPLSAPTGTG